MMSDSTRILDAIRRLVRHLRIADRAAQSELGISGAQLFALAELGKTPALSLTPEPHQTVTAWPRLSIAVVVNFWSPAVVVWTMNSVPIGTPLVLNCWP